ncbi:MAG: hypothetical protein WCK31_04860 [bacterium]
MQETSNEKPPTMSVERIPIGECWQFIYSKKLGLIVANDSLEGHSTMCDKIKWKAVVVGGHILKVDNHKITVDRFNTQSITEGKTNYVSQLKYPTTEVFSEIIDKYSIDEVERIDCVSEEERIRLLAEYHKQFRDGD